MTSTKKGLEKNFNVRFIVELVQIVSGVLIAMIKINLKAYIPHYVCNYKQVDRWFFVEDCLQTYHTRLAVIPESAGYFSKPVVNETGCLIRNSKCNGERQAHIIPEETGPCIYRLFLFKFANEKWSLSGSAVSNYFFINLSFFILLPLFLGHF